MTKPIFLALLLAATVVTKTAVAQGTAIDCPWSAKIEIENKNGSRLGHFSDLNIKAVRHFEKTYKSPKGQYWVVTKQGCRVKFIKDSIVYRVDYYKSGSWRNTVMSYRADHAPESVLRTLKGYLNDYDIAQISELIYGPTRAYFVNLIGYKSLKTVRIMDGELELVSDFKKQSKDSLPIAYGTK